MAAAAAAEPADESSDERVQLGMTRVTSSDRKRAKKDDSGQKDKKGNKKHKTKQRKEEKEAAKARAKRPHDDVDPDEGHDDWETLFNVADAELKELKAKFQKSVERKKTAVNDATKYLAENKKKQKKIDEMQKKIDQMNTTLLMSRGAVDLLGDMNSDELELNRRWSAEAAEGNLLEPDEGLVVETATHADGTVLSAVPAEEDPPVADAYVPPPMRQ
jgi:hypothetical protein